MGEFLFQEKVALITGSARGIGSVVARTFADFGADVVITHRKKGGASETKGKTLCEEIRERGGRALLLNLDISQKKSVHKAISDTEAHFGRLDFLILNAARAPFKPIEKLFERELKDLVNTNYLGHIFCIQESIPLLEKTHGKIVFVSSLGSRFHHPSYPLGSMKAAMESVIRDCAESLRERGISANGICGGIIRTDSFKTLRMYWDGIDRLPERLFVTPKEIADVVMFLCGPWSRGIVGQTLVVDKGMSNSLFRAIGP